MEPKLIEVKIVNPDSIKWIIIAVAVIVAFIFAIAVIAWLGLLPDAIKNISEAFKIAFSN